MSFERENRYVVMKTKDILRYLNAEDLAALRRMDDKINDGRIARGALPLCVVCIESDWPEYEPVWEMIRRRVQGEGR